MQGSKSRWKYGRAVLCLGREEKMPNFVSFQLNSSWYVFLNNKTYATMKYALKGRRLPNLRVLNELSKLQGQIVSNLNAYLLVTCASTCQHKIEEPFVLY